jgi:hypothetical protein
MIITLSGLGIAIYLLTASGKCRKDAIVFDLRGVSVDRRRFSHQIV